jgi:hypothetical protein
LQRSVKTACKSENHAKTTSKHQTSQSDKHEKKAANAQITLTASSIWRILRLFYSPYCCPANERLMRVFSSYVEGLGIMEEKERGIRGR